MKKLSSIAIVLFLATSLYSQDYISLIKYNTSMPMGDMEEFISNYSWKGFELGSKKYMSRNTTIGFVVGWNVFDEKESGTWTDGTTTGTGTQIRYINAFPILLNGHYYLGRKRGTRPFLGLNLGTYYIEKKINFGVLTRVETNWHLGFAPEIGILIPLGETLLDFSAKYNYAMAAGGSIDYTYLGINLGFAFNH